MSSLRSDKTPSKSSQRSKHNTPSPYPQKTPIVSNSNNTKRRTIAQVGTQSQKVGNKSNRNSISNAYLNKSVSPQPSQSHTFGAERNNQLRQSNQKGVGDDYKKIFNMENIINATQQQNNNQKDGKMIEMHASEPIINNYSDQQQYQYFSSINNQARREPESQKNNIINAFQSNTRSSLATSNNLFAQSQKDENNLFFRKENNSFNNQNSSIDLQKQTSVQQEAPSFFRTNYQQEKLFQGAQKFNNQSSNIMEDENKPNTTLIHEFFQSNGQQNKNQLEQVKSSQMQIFKETSEGSQSKNQSNIFAIRPNTQNIIPNQNTGIVLQEKNLNSLIQSENSNQSISQIYNKDPQASQQLLSGPSNLKDLRSRHKQLKSESGEKSFNLQNNILDKIKDINEKMKFYAKKSSDQGTKNVNSNDQSKCDIKNNSIMMSEDLLSSNADPTINDQNKTLEDSLIQKLKLVVNSEEEFDQSSQNQLFRKGDSQHDNLYKDSRNKYITTKLDMIQESNASKNSFVSGVFYQSGEQSRNKENEIGLTEEILNGKRKEFQLQNFNIFGSQISDIQASKKNLFGNYTYKEEDEDFSDKEQQGERQARCDFESNLFDSSDESACEQKQFKRSNPKKLSKGNYDRSFSQMNNGGDVSAEGKQNMTNSILDRAFIGDVTAIYSAERNNNDTSIRAQDSFKFETSQPSQNLKKFHSDIFVNNQEGVDFNQDNQSIKRLDQMGCSDISPIQSQVQAKSSNSGSKKDNNQLIEELNHISQPTPSISRELEISQIQVFDTHSLEQGKNSTSLFKKQDTGCSSQNENFIIDLSQSQSYKPENISSQSNENLLKEEIQTPIIQLKLKKFLENVGYYNNHQRKEQINEIMSKITLGLVIDKANVSKLEDEINNKTIVEEGQYNNRVSLGQCSDYMSCQSRFSIPPLISDMMIVNQQQEKNNQSGQYKNSEDLNNLNQNQDIQIICDNQKSLSNEEKQPNQESIENKHFEVLKREVEILFQLCKGEDQAEKNISSKIVNEVLCPTFGQKTLQEAIKLAIKKGRQMRTSQSNKNRRRLSSNEDNSSNQVIIEKDEEESDQKQNEVTPQPPQNEKDILLSSTIIPTRGIKRKMPTRGNQKKKQSSKSASDSSCDDISESESESSGSVSLISLGGISNKDPSKNNKQQKNKKLKK